MEYSPPPLFKQGASARAKVVFFSLIAIALLIADSRVRSLALIRQAVGTVLYPLQMVALVPRDMTLNVTSYFTTLATVEHENKALKIQQASNAQMLQQAQQLAAENNQLRKLLGTSEQLVVPSLMSEILYDARDKYSRKIVLNRGSQDGVALGQPVIDDVGVVGQVTRIFPFTSEVTLLTDKDQAIPVQVVRSGLRSVAYGQGQSGILDLRFMAANADIRNGDVLVTSGIDGVYPPGLAVAKVVQVENKSSDAFAHIQCQPSAGIDRNRQLLILLANTDIEARPESEEDRDKKDKFGKKRSREMFRDTGKDAAGAPAAATGLPVTAPAAAPAGLPAAAGAVAPDVLKEPVRPAAPIIKDVLRAPPEPVKEAPKPAVAPAAGPVTSRAPAPPPAATLQKATTP